MRHKLDPARVKAYVVVVTLSFLSTGDDAVPVLLGDTEEG